MADFCSDTQHLLLLLQGGLGNQLMQYVFAETLAKSTDRCLLGSKVLFGSKIRRFRGVTCRSVSPLLEHRFSWKVVPWHHEFWARLRARLPEAIVSTVITDCVLAEAAHAPDPLRYLSNRHVIHTHATHPLVFNPLFSESWHRILVDLGSYLRRPPPNIALHVRRADYVSHSSGFCVLPESYYRSAIERALVFSASQVSSPVIHAYSDDPAWCEAHLQDPRWSLRISVGSPEQDLASMAHARILITANSSLSAVAAHLAQLRESQTKVLTPQRWLLVDDGRLGDLRKPDWVVVKP